MSKNKGYILRDWDPPKCEEPVEFQAFSYSVDDGTSDEDDFDNMDFTVHMFGKNRSGDSVAVHVKGYHPTFCVKFDSDISTHEEYLELYDLLGRQLCTWDFSEKPTQTAEYSDHLQTLKEPIMYKKDCWGFKFEKQEPFFTFAFRSRFAYNKILSIFKACQKNTMSEDEMHEFYDNYNSIVDSKGKPARLEQGEFLKDTALETGVPIKALNFITKLGKAYLPLRFAKGKLFEVIDPILRFAHMRNLKMAGWTRINNYMLASKQRSITACAVEMYTTYENLEPIQCDDINAHLKEMSFDIEAYSHNDLFPDPSDLRNYCYQIGITLKKYADKGYDRLLLHCRTPEELRGMNSGLCKAIPDIPTCLRSHKPLEMCENKECCKLKNHDVYNVKTHVENFETEKELLMRFSQIIVKEDPDLIYAYNSDIFDWNYIMVRAQVTMQDDPKSLRKFRTMSRLKSYQVEVKEAKFASSAYGDNKYMRADIPGRLNIDLMIWVQRNMPADRYPSYSLDTVAEKEIAEVKRDVDAKDIFQAFRSGDPDELTRIGDYCCQDTMLVQKLINKLDVVTQMFEMANITDTPPMYLLQKGQQIKCFSQLSKEAMEKGFLIPLAEDREDGKFKGAIVLEPIIGKYDSPVSVLDFASLYPSIQVAYKVCYTTIVLDDNLLEEILKLRSQQQPLVLNGVKFDLIEWEEDTYIFYDIGKQECTTFTDIEDAKKMGYTSRQILESMEKTSETTGSLSPSKSLQDAKKTKTENLFWRKYGTSFWEKGVKQHTYAFAQVESSIIPDLQTRLKKSRKAVKAMMAPIEHSKNPDDQLKYRVLNGRQLAIKVSMNSIYGFTSAFMMNLQALSASVTAKGRQMIEATKGFLENDFEHIAKTTLWTKSDVLTFFSPDGKQITAEEDSLNHQWMFNFKGQELCRTNIGHIPQNWIKKFPVAVEGKPWTEKNLFTKVVAGDTDSCFANFPTSSLAEAISLCHKAAELLTDKVFNRAPIEMEYEKTYYPLYIQKKKNYIGLKYEMDDARWKIDYKGIAIKRRNYCDYVKEVFWNVIYPALGVEPLIKDDGRKELRKVTWDFNDRPIKAIEALESSLMKLTKHQVPLENFIISASLKSNYKGPKCTICQGKGKVHFCKTSAKDEDCEKCPCRNHTKEKDCSKCRCSECGGRGIIVNLPHIQLAKRMKERDEGSAPISGQRFGYIIVNDPSRKSELWARSEDPKYAKQNNLMPDYLFYLDQQIRKPLSTFLSLLDMREETESVFTKIQNVLFNDLKRRRKLLEKDVRRTYFSMNEYGKRSNGIEPLKAPKKQAVNKKQKENDLKKAHPSISSFFQKVDSSKN